MNNSAKITNRTGQALPAKVSAIDLERMTTRLMGYGPIERSAEILASGLRVGLPVSFLEPQFGFPEVLVGAEWILMYRDMDYLIATPIHLWPEFLDSLHRKLCSEGGLSDQSFFSLYVNRAHRVRTDKRYRWNIHEALANELHHENSTCPLVFQTFGPTIEIRTRSRHFKELRLAEAEAVELRQKATSLRLPGITQDESSAPQIARFSGSKTLKA